ncbi:gluconolactonase [Parasphingopyxis lamellibrachiae]|uniref:Gluconolactonase n=2 Tax=Parasphingopyxis lamellibrachiae TaxID=680125 RepID=A0A3D9FEA9_9SPHN|nr:gluconolactonase [Parasphingopyxis lamellibrachiae]
MPKPLTILNVQQVFPAGNLCGEGIVWDDRIGQLYWCDINGFAVYRYDPHGGCCKSWLFDEPVVSIMLGRERNEIVLAMASRIVLWSPEQESISDPIFTLDSYPEVRLNDGQIAPDGSIWIGSMQNNLGPDGEPLPVKKVMGSLYRIDHNGFEIVKDEIGIANTVCWDEDRNRFYFADSLRNIIWSFGWKAGKAKLTDERELLADHPRGVPDGSTLDSEGYLWNCRFGGSCLLRISPDGRVDRIVELPANNPTNCVFGDDRQNRLFVTSAAIDTPTPTRFDGSLFGCQTNVTGNRANRLSHFGPPM